MFKPINNNNSLQRESLDPLNILTKFKDKKVVVIGEGILDSYLYGKSYQLCREAPVPVISFSKQIFSPGGAANTAVSLSRLGAEVIFLSVLGNDSEGKKLKDILNNNNVNTKHIIFTHQRISLFKQRIISGNQMLLRIDKGSKDPIGKEIRKRLINSLKQVINISDAMIVSDYASGMLVPEIREEIFSIQRALPILTALDARSLLPYIESTFDLVKPNYIEAIKVLGIPEIQGSERVKQIISNSNIILKKINASIVAVTLDEDGAIILEKNLRPYRIYARALERPNTSGAGDTFISAFVLSLTCGADSSVSSEIASLAASIAVGKKASTVTCSNQELIGYFAQKNKEIMTLAELSALRAFYDSQGLKIIFTNGCFDILHRGHIYFLNQCKSLGDILIVGVNDDESIRLIKGKHRPLNRLIDRIQILQSLSCVDHVISFKGPAPIDIIKILKPRIFVKGGNHLIDELPEVPLIKQQGGEICLLPYLNEYSTEGIIKKVRVTIETTVKNEEIKNG